MNGYNTDNYNEQGGSKRVIGGVLEILDSAEVLGMAQIRQYKWTAEQAVAADDDGILASATLGAAATTVATGLDDMPCARNVLLTPSASMGTTKKATVHGTDIEGAVISEELTFNNATAVPGAKAFAGVTSIVLPIREHAPVAQVETATAAGTVSTAGNALVTVTSALFAEAVAVDVPVVLNDDAAAIALAIRTALSADESISEHFTVGGADAAVILTAKVAAANDTTLNIAIDDGTGEGASAGVTTVASSANTTAGVAPDTIKLGWSDKLGMPRKMANGVHHIATYLGAVVEANAPTFATSGTAISGNTIDLNSALDGSTVETLVLVR